MKIVVPVKHVPESTAPVRYAPDGTLDRAGVEGRLSELDEYAVEQAVSLVEKGLPATITFLTMGPARAADGLRKALAMGGDDAVHISDEALHGSDALATSLVLARAIERLGFDLVMTGMASTDAEMPSSRPARAAPRDPPAHLRGRAVRRRRLRGDPAELGGRRGRRRRAAARAGVRHRRDR